MEDLHCAHCGEDFPELEEIEESTWQQWRCPACGSWNNRTDAPVSIAPSKEPNICPECGSAPSVDETPHEEFCPHYSHY
jgi:DNA-directed RNA polymerase subunit RPC12/RpoP